MRFMETFQPLFTSSCVRRFSLVLGMAAFFLFTGLSVMADGGGPMRPATPAEISAFNHVMSTLDIALPKIPVGWTRDETIQAGELKTVPVGSEKEVMIFSFHCTWRDLKAIERSEKDQMADIESEASSMKDRQKAMEALQESQAKLAEKFGEAIAKGNTAEAERLQKEMEAFSQKNLEPLIKEADEQVKKIVKKNALHDTEIRIHVTVNDREINVEAKKLDPSPVAGGLAYRIPGREEESGQWTESQTHIFLGSWKEQPQDGSADLRLIPSLSLSAGHEAPQNLHILITADESRTAELIEKTNWNALKALLSWKP